jgi:hypothetical protein
LRPRRRGVLLPNPRRRDPTAALPCHVQGCGCEAFLGAASVIVCGVCGGRYTTQSGLENHVYARHPGLRDRERSTVIAGAIRGRPSMNPWEFETFRHMDSALRDLETLADRYPDRPQGVVRPPAKGSRPRRRRPAVRRAP